MMTVVAHRDVSTAFSYAYLQEKITKGPIVNYVPGGGGGGGGFQKSVVF